MESIEDIYRARLALLVETAGAGKQTQLADRLGKSPAQLSQWLNASKDSKTGIPRVMSRAIARQIETTLALPRGWMDQPLADIERKMIPRLRNEVPPAPDEVKFAGVDSAEFAGSPPPPRLVPVVGTARMGDDGHYDEMSPVPGAGDGHIDIATKDPHAYCLRVKGQSMFPAIRDGWYVVVEPHGTPREGEYVLLKLRDGQKMVKEFLFRRAEAIEVMSVNGGDRMTIDYADVEIQPVAAVVPPSKWRPD